MGEGGEQEDRTVIGGEPVTFGYARGLIQDVHGVDADVAFGVPFGILRDSEEVLDFGEVDDPAGGLQIFGDAAGVGAFDGPLHEFFGNAFAG